MKKTILTIIAILAILSAVFFAYKYFFGHSNSYCWPYCPNMTDADREKIKRDALDAGCPDQKIVNKMPGTSGGSSSYYIKNGHRKEISDYDAAWVSANCKVPTEDVY